MSIKAIIGLGNEGREYEKTYHNVGVFGASLFKERASVEGLSLEFFSPQGFMNTIGGPVVMDFMKKKNLKPAESLIIKDDSDLLIGEYKLVKGGGTAGHKGAASVLGYIEGWGYTDTVSPEKSSEDSPWWLKIGVRDPHERKRKKAGDFVLQKWSKSDEKIFENVLDQAWEELVAQRLLTESA